MRYYDFSFKTDADRLSGDLRMLKHTAGLGYYDNIFEGLSQYMYENLRNNMYFLIYRVEEDLVYSNFCFDDRLLTFDEAYGDIIGILKDVFDIRKAASEPEEIIMEQYLADIIEAERRNYLHGRGLVADRSKIWIYDNYYRNTKEQAYYFKFDEKMIQPEAEISGRIYDENFEKELINIETHVNNSSHTGNMVHYVLSCRSMAASTDMVETIMQKLYKAKRVRSRRIEFISDIVPDLYMRNDNHFEDVIENNSGGAVVINLTERFGKNPAEYSMTCKYIEKLVKKYKKDNLFIFVYNIDNPGFAFTLLPEIKNYVSLVTLKEGTGDRNAAVKYMKGLIKGSEYAKYAHQAAEFMEQFPGTKFTQTAVLDAYEQFESWCINKNIMKAYDFDSNDDFFLDRDENMASAYDRLQNMVGLKAVKEQIDEIIAEDVVEKERQRRQGSDYVTATMHMIFAGNPGTAKTTVAKLFAQIAKEKGVLKSGAFVEYKCNGIIGNGSYTLSEAFAMAKGGVLFIDEA